MLNDLYRQASDPSVLATQGFSYELKWHVGKQCKNPTTRITNPVVNQPKKGKFTEADLGLLDLFWWDNRSGLMTEVGRDTGRVGQDVKKSTKSVFQNRRWNSNLLSDIL